MIRFDATTRPRLKHHGRRTVVRERYSAAPSARPWDQVEAVLLGLQSTPRRRRTKSWAKSIVPGQREAQRLADQLMEKVNDRNNEPQFFASDGETLNAVYNKCRKLTCLT